MTPQRRPALARWERQDGNQRDNKHHPLPHPSLVHQRPLPPLHPLQHEEGPCLVHHQPLPLCCLKHEWGGSSRPPSATTTPLLPQMRGGPRLVHHLPPLPLRRLKCEEGLHLVHHQHHHPSIASNVSGGARFAHHHPPPPLPRFKSKRRGLVYRSCQR